MKETKTNWHKASSAEVKKIVYQYCQQFLCSRRHQQPHRISDCVSSMRPAVWKTCVKKMFSEVWIMNFQHNTNLLVHSLVDRASDFEKWRSLVQNSCLQKQKQKWKQAHPLLFHGKEADSGNKDWITCLWHTDSLVLGMFITEITDETAKLNCSNRKW